LSQEFIWFGDYDFRDQKIAFNNCEKTEELILVVMKNNSLHNFMYIYTIDKDFLRYK
jgi:hypothetical protein